MKKKQILIPISIVLTLLVFRIILGIQINFSHEDYKQIYLIGLEHAFSENWSYWGPDVVWSETRLPGGMQGFLAGFPIQLFKHPYSPIVFSNLLSVIGLTLLSLYAKKRFPTLNLNFLLALLLLLPFYLYHGVVLLNTAYLIFTGALLFIPVFELFIYRDSLIFKNTGVYFLFIGFSLLITYQLHLTWVMYLPFICVLLILEIKRDYSGIWKLPLYLFVGASISGSLLIPTVMDYGSAIYQNTEGNLNFQPARFGRIFELFTRYFSYATFDITPTYNFYQVATEKSLVTLILIWAVKLFSLIQFAGIFISFYFIKKTPEFKRTFLLFILSLIMCVVLFALSNKHLSSRTYLLLFPIPLWLSFYSYEYMFRKKPFKIIMNSVIGLTFLAYLGVASMNYHEKFSFYANKEKIEAAFDKEDPTLFGKRRTSLMDKYK